MTVPSSLSLIFSAESTLGRLDKILLTYHAATRRWLVDILTRIRANQVTCIATLNSAMHPQTKAQDVLETFNRQVELYEAEIQVRPKLIRGRRLGRRKFIDAELRVDKDRI